MSMAEDMEPRVDFLSYGDESPCSVDDEYWITARGGHMEFSDMDDEHLKNSIKLCMRKRWPVPVLMLAELLSRKGLLE